MPFRTNSTTLENLLSNNPELNIPVHDYNINVTSNNGDFLDKNTTYKEFLKFDGIGKDTHLYIHLPLCDYICHFCNYVKRRIKSNNKESELDLWVDLLINESNLYLNNTPWVKKANIKSFYIGGGTGALLLNNESAITRLIEHVKSNYHIDKDCEFSIEGNPENFTNSTIKLALNLGFNRFSVGVQSLQKKVNEFTNRGHTKNDAFNAIKLLKKTGKPFSVDMMFGLPYQTVESVKCDIETLIKYGVPAITIYRLRNSDRENMGIGNSSVWNSKKYKTLLDLQGLFPDVIETYKMRDAITDILRNNKYTPSPCGWWNQPSTYPEGNIPRVSKDKWENYNTMLALGPGAYGWLSGGNPKIIQTHNQTNISEYVDYMQTKPDLPPLAFGRALEGNIAIGTRLAFSYKANQPIYIQEYQEQFGIDIINDSPFKHVFKLLQEKDLITLSDDSSYFLPTWKGEELHEEIMYVYFHEMIGSSSQVMCNRIGKKDNLKNDFKITATS